MGVVKCVLLNTQWPRVRTGDFVRFQYTFCFTPMWAELSLAEKSVFPPPYTFSCCSPLLVSSDVAQRRCAVVWQLTISFVLLNLALVRKHKLCYHGLSVFSSDQRSQPSLSACALLSATALGQNIYVTTKDCWDKTTCTALIYTVRPPVRYNLCWVCRFGPLSKTLSRCVKLQSRESKWVVTS
jgi:hypothetical protein